MPTTVNDASTMFATEADLTSGGKTIPAGSYTLFTKRVDDKTWHLVVNTQDGAVGHEPRRELGPHRGPAHLGAGGLERRAVHHRVG